ncbi:hypothetical protein GQ457_11G003030 [Hibiscus cannabinus]
MCLKLPKVSLQDPEYRYPRYDTNTPNSRTDTHSIFLKPEIPVAIWRIDTQGEYRYPRHEYQYPLHQKSSWISISKSNFLIDIRLLHVQIIKSNFASETFILNRLIGAYGKCGSLEDSRKLGYVDDAAGIFSSMHEHDQCSWNLIISGFAQQDRFDEALHSCVRMHGDDFVLNEYSFGSSLGVCSG